MLIMDPSASAALRFTAGACGRFHARKTVSGGSSGMTAERLQLVGAVIDAYAG